MEGNKEKKSSRFKRCHVSASQEIFLRRCGFGQRDVPRDSFPSLLRVSQSPPLNDGIAPRRDSETDSVIDSVYDDEQFESGPVQFVSPQKSTTTADSIPAKKLKIPLRDVVKAIVMNSRSTEEDEEMEKKTSCVQILIKKGFNFP